MPNHDLITGVPKLISEIVVVRSKKKVVAKIHGQLCALSELNIHYPTKLTKLQLN